jgi:hypothetical protein
VRFVKKKDEIYFESGIAILFFSTYNVSCWEHFVKKKDEIYFEGGIASLFFSTYNVSCWVGFVKLKGEIVLFLYDCAGCTCLIVCTPLFRVDKCLENVPDTPYTFNAPRNVHTGTPTVHPMPPLSDGGETPSGAATGHLTDTSDPTLERPQSIILKPSDRVHRLVCRSLGDANVARCSL